MKKVSLLFPALTLCAQIAFSQVTPNSNRFDVENYIAIDNHGKYYPYTAHGFYENAASGATARIYLLPLLNLDINKIKFIDSHGLETDLSSDNIRSMIIPVSVDLTLPNESQKAAIAAVVKGHTTIQGYFPDMARNSITHMPVVSPMINMGDPIYTQIMSMATTYQSDILNPQQQFINDYNTLYKAQIIDITELEIIVKAGNEIVYKERIPTTMILASGTTKNIAIDNPSEYIKNLIAHGNGEILVSYKFKDSQSSTLSFHADATAIVNQFLSEAYQSSVSQSSSGWSFLGFGSSSKSISQAFNQQVNQQYNGQHIANTVIEMYDANDQMIKEFEDAFFPTLAKDQVIQNHLDAANKAKLAGDATLQKLHEDYVKVLQNNDPNLAPNIEAAVAALGKEDYIGFIANGIRWGDYSGNGNFVFRRTLNSNEMTSTATNWSQTRVVSIQHAVTQPVLTPKEVKFRASIGVIDGIPYSGNLFMSNGFSASMQNVNGVVIGPITVGGALALNNIYPGNLMTKIGLYSVYSGQTIVDALSHYSAGQTVYITLVVPTNNPNVFQEQRVQVTLGTYPKTN